MFETMKKENYYRSIAKNEKCTNTIKEKEYIKKYSGYS